MAFCASARADIFALAIRLLVRPKSVMSWLTVTPPAARS